MSLFFDRPLSVDAAFVIRDDPDGVLDTALVGQALWDQLVPPDAPPFTDKICVSIADTYNDGGLTVWMWLDENVADSQLSIPRSWSNKYPDIFPQRRNTVSITPTKPIALTEVFISALSADAYDAAIAGQAHLERWLCDSQRIIRQSSVYSCDATELTERVNGYMSYDEKPLYFQIDMLEPVLQGFCQKGTTSFIVSPAPDGYASSFSCPLANPVENEWDRINIGEDFLANSLGQPFQYPIDANGETSTDTESDISVPVRSHTIEFEVRPLDRRPPDSLDDRNVYVRTTDLGRIGILNGDWAVLKDKERASSRLVRVVADDSLVETSGRVVASPTLLYNVCGDTWPPHSSMVKIYPSPFGSGPPVVPTARAVTVARIASPVSVDRTYERAFLQALKDHFIGRNTLLKTGDIISVAVNSDQRSTLGEDTTLSDESGRRDEAVFFQIMNVDHDVVATDPSLSLDTYLGSTLGELGCWFDPATTQMNQTGVEHSRVPDVAAYLGLGSASRSQAVPSGTKTALGKLLDMATVVLGKNSASYNLPLTALLSGNRGCGKYTTARTVARLLGFHVLEINCYDALGDNDIHTEGVLRARFEKAADCSPCMIILRQLDGLASKAGAENKTGSVMANVLRDCLADVHKSWKLTGYPVIVCGLSNDSSKLPSDFVSCFKHEIVFEAPDEGERLDILKAALTGKTIAPDVSVQNLATQTAALVAGDLADLVSRAEVAAIERAGVLSQDASVDDIMRAGVALSNADFEGALGKARASYSEGIGAPKIPNVSWDDVGGLSHVKSDILDTIQLPLDYPELFSDGFKKRSGILLYGPPGTGKTLVAKAVATSFALNFFSVKGPELLNMYIGESEANVRRIFQRARDAKPCVIFFDELDSIAPKRGNTGDSGGVMDRIVSQLLSELDGMAGSGGADVFVIGATNRPDLLDAALLRPGRFDRMLYLGVSKTHEEQEKILEALTRKFRLAPDLNLKEVAEGCSFNLTGADFYALCADALLNAMTRKAEDLDKVIATLNANPDSHSHPHPLTPQYYLAELATPEEIAVLVTKDDFELALRKLIPSVSEAEMQHYRRIQSQFSQERGESL